VSWKSSKVLLDTTKLIEGFAASPFSSHRANIIHRVELYHDPSNAKVLLGLIEDDILRIMSIPRKTQTNEAIEADIVCLGGPCKCSPGHFLGKLFILTKTIL
jgi:hypothetical protein